MPAKMPTAPPAWLTLAFAPLEADGACVLELDAGAEELGAVVEVAVEVSVAAELPVGVAMVLGLVSTVEVAGGGAAVSILMLVICSSRWTMPVYSYLMKLSQ